MKTPACYIRSMQRIIALFDIDGTLLRAGGAGRRAVELALSEVLDRRNRALHLSIRVIAMGRIQILAREPFRITEPCGHQRPATRGHGLQDRQALEIMQRGRQYNISGPQMRAILGYRLDVAPVPDAIGVLPQ